MAALLSHPWISRMEGDASLLCKQCSIARIRRRDVQWPRPVSSRAPQAKARLSTASISRQNKLPAVFLPAPARMPKQQPILKSKKSNGAEEDPQSRSMGASYESSVQRLPLNPASPNAPDEQSEDAISSIRRPRALQAIYFRPLKRKAQYGVPACDLQLRSYSVRNVEFFADFALRAAYYLGLPASGPVPLPRITERWTVPRSNFIFKKSQENFERITIRRLIQIQDASTETVEIWLAFLRKHAYYGIGMKANVWQYEKIGVGKTMDVSLENLKQALDPRWAHFGRRKTLETSEKAYEMIKDENFGEPAKAPQITASL